MARNDAAVRAKEQLPLDVEGDDGRGPAGGDGGDERAQAARRPAARAEDRHLSRPAARTTWRRRGTCAAARRSTASPRAAASRCTWPDTRRRWRRWTSRRRRLRRLAPTRRPTGSGTRSSARRTFSTCSAATPRRGGNSRWSCSTRPAFTKSRQNIEAAARGYKDINLRALRLLAPGGVLVTCSCSHHMSEAMLLEIVARGVARRRPHPARARAAHAVTGSPDSADRARNPVLEVPDPRGGVKAPRSRP